MLLLCRYVLLRDLSWGLIANEIILVLGVTTQGVLMIRGRERLNNLALAMTFIFQITYLIFLVKIALIVLIPVLPIFAQLMLGSHFWLLDPSKALIILFIMVVLFPIGVLIFFLTIFPAFALTWTSVHTLKESFLAAKARLGAAGVIRAIFLGIVVFLGVRNLALIQPQSGVFDLLREDFNNPSGRRLLYDQEDRVRRGLLNAYLSSYRYLSDQTNPPNVGRAYVGLIYPFGHELEELINHIYKWLIAEFIYQGDRAADAVLAEHWYLRYFDKDIQEGERRAINSALRSSLFGGENKGGLIDIDAKKVLLKKQQIEITEAGSLAEVTVHESYASESDRLEEVVYHFALPEDAALTGLWLSDGSNPDRKFAFRISPRGAAQSVYNGIVAERQDPAILEQVGPNIYRLRVFPIFQRHGVRTAEAADLHMWFSYIAAPDASGNWPVPQLVERRNIYWDDRTERTVNGQTVGNSNEWFTKFSVKPRNNASDTEFRWGRYRVKRTLLADKKGVVAGKGGSVAVIIDTSRSMKDHLLDIQRQMPGYSQFNFEFFTVSDGGLIPYDSTKSAEFPLMAFGRLSINQLIDAYQENGKNYRALLVLTDEGSYDEKWRVRRNLPPTFIIHWSKKYPRDYGDDLSAFLMTHGNGIAFSVDEALARLTVFEQLLDINDSSYFRVTEDSIWRFTEEKKAVDSLQDNLKPAKSLQALAAKAIIPYLARSVAEDDVKVKGEALNRVHEEAIRNGIVTLFSSMIVLVNDRQETALNQAETESNKFERKTETGIEALQRMFGSISATPEPHEWVLFGLVLIALFVFLKNRDLRRIVVVRAMH